MAVDSTYKITAITGKTGAAGKDGSSVYAEYSADKSSWHSTFTDGDLYMRTSSDGESWSEGVRIVGEKGDKGDKGDTGATGAKGDKGDTGATGATGATGITVKCSAGALAFTLRRDKTTNYQSQSFTVALYRGSTLLTLSSSSVSAASAAGVTAAKSGTSTITVTVTASSGGSTIPSGKITVNMVYSGVTYSVDVPITAAGSGKYLGKLTALPTASAASLGNYFVAGSTFTASSVTYTISYVYECVCTAASTYKWQSTTAIDTASFSDIISLATVSNTQAVSLVERLVANSAFIKSLAAEIITLQSGGLIKSSNYDGGTTTDDDGNTILDTDNPGTQGFAMDSAGSSDFVNMHATNLTANQGVFKDDCIFAGSIASGPLYLDNVNPTNLESQLVFNAGDSTEALWNAIKNITEATVVNGIVTYNGVSYAFSHIAQTSTSSSNMIITLEDKNLNRVNWTGKEDDEANNRWYGFITVYSNGAYKTLEPSITLNLYNPEGKTLKLTDLPTSASSESGYVYVDSEGYLRLS